MTKYQLHVPTESFGFIGADIEGEAADAVLAYKDLSQAWNGGSGVGIRSLSSLVIELVKTGAIKSGGDYDFSANESLLLKEITKQLRTNNK